MQFPSPLLRCCRRGPFPQAALPCQGTGGPDEGAACSDRTQKSGGTFRSRRARWCRPNPRQKAADSCADGLIPFGLYGGWKDKKGGAGEDQVRQAAFAFFMALQVRQMESPFLYM
jgi:hypothetical protein